MKKMIDALLTVLGLASLLEGWRRFRKKVPKPTQRKQVTRDDYMSGNYERELNQRDSEVQSNRRWGMTFIGTGIGFLFAGVYILARMISPDREKE